MVKKVSILGCGGRENAILQKLTEQGVSVNMYSDKNSFLNDISSDFGIVSMEDYLSSGISDEMKIPLFGPSREMALIESSKIYSKDFMIKNNIPTPSYRVFGSGEEPHSYMERGEKVLKLDGLHKGKGVFMDDYVIPQEPFLCEERLYGEEVSVMGFCNGKNIELMPQIIDNKRLGDNDIGPNTGGMGAIGPVDILDSSEISIVKKHMEKVVDKLKFKGVLYAGLMKTTEGIYFLEFNSRLGDPETQIVMSLLDSDLYTIMLNCINGIDNNIRWKDLKAVGVVLSHTDYPLKKSMVPLEIKIDGFIDHKLKIYWSGDGKKTYGGRVSTMVALSDSIQKSRRIVYNNIHKIKYEKRYYRRDIGLKYVCKNSFFEKKKVAIIGSGNGTSILELLQLGMIDLVISDKNKGMIKNATKYGIKTFYFPEIDYEVLINTIDLFKIDIILCVGFMKILPAFFCDYFEGKLFNIHPSLLPDHKKLMDLKVHENVIRNKDKYTGCTIHKVTQYVDEGEIYLQKQIAIPDECDTPQKLKDIVQNLEKKAIIEFIMLMGSEKISYPVSIEKGDEFVKNIEKYLPEKMGSFCSLVNFGSETWGFACDGVGTKLELAREYGMWDGIGQDLVAMSVNDLIVRGVKPLIFMDYIALSKIDTGFLEKIITDIRTVCQRYDINLVGGETAEMPGIYKYKNIDIAGFSSGIVVGDIYPKTDLIKTGCKIYGIRSNGIHSNGFSLVRKILQNDTYDIKKILKPTRIYMECFDFMEKYGDHLLGLAHITGGGLIGNIQRILPSGLQPFFDQNISIEEEFLWIMKKSQLNHTEMLSTFNCGFGMILIFDENVSVTDDDLHHIGYVINNKNI